MKKAMVLSVFLLTSIFAGCSVTPENNASADAGVQLAFDTSMVAREFTDELVAEMLAGKGIVDYDIELTSGGLITSDPSVYVVGYRYMYNGVTDLYGYKLKQAESGFTVLEEGYEVGKFVVGDNK